MSSIQTNPDSQDIHCHPYYTNDKVSAIILEIPSNHFESFKILLARALNCWMEAPSEWHALSALLENNPALKDYYIAKGAVKEKP